MFLQSDGSNDERRENPLYGIWYLLEGLIQRVMYGLVIAAYKVEVIADVLNHSVMVFYYALLRHAPLEIPYIMLTTECVTCFIKLVQYFICVQ